MPSGSPNYDATYDIKRFYAILTDARGSYNDYLNARLIRGIRSIRGYQEHVWSAGQKIENIAYRYHGVTTTYPMIMIYNGIVTSFEIQAGTVLRIPDKAELSRVLTALVSQAAKEKAISEGRDQSQIGQLVSI